MMKRALLWSTMWFVIGSAGYPHAAAAVTEAQLQASQQIAEQLLEQGQAACARGDYEDAIAFFAQGLGAIRTVGTGSQAPSAVPRPLSRVHAELSRQLVLAIDQVSKILTRKWLDKSGHDVLLANQAKSRLDEEAGMLGTLAHGSTPGLHDPSPSVSGEDEADQEFVNRLWSNVSLKRGIIAVVEGNRTVRDISIQRLRALGHVDWAEALQTPHEDAQAVIPQLRALLW